MPKGSTPAAVGQHGNDRGGGAASPRRCNSQARATARCSGRERVGEGGERSSASGSCVGLGKGGASTLNKAEAQVRCVGATQDMPSPDRGMSHQSDCDDVRMRLPLCPFQAPVRARVAKSAMRPRTACTSSTTLQEKNDHRVGGRPEGRVQTARLSVTLILSPRNMASRLADRARSSASSVSRVTVSGVMGVFQ